MSNFKTLADLNKKDPKTPLDTSALTEPLQAALRAVYFERQIGNLCGVHVVNNALQQRNFDEIRLAEIAELFDKTEYDRMAEAGTHTQEFKDFLDKPSSNYDDSGNFSIQVLTHAFLLFGVELIPWNSENPRAQAARKNPVNQQLFLIHASDHWYCYRRFGGCQWVLLNSMETHPSLVTDTYMQMLLASMEQDKRITMYFGFGNLNSPADLEFAKYHRIQLGASSGKILGSGDIAAPTKSTNSNPESHAQGKTIGAQEVRKQREAFLARFQTQKKPEDEQRPSNSSPNPE